MLRKNLGERAQQGDPYFRWRGGDVSRLEALTDAVFALSLTLIVVSLEVPDSFRALSQAFLLLPAFAICFALLLYVWVSHFRFHRRYGLEDGITVTLNGVLLFLVLGYVYPLKFLFYWLWSMWGGLDGGVARPTEVEAQQLMVAYGVGVVGIFGVLWLMHFVAWRRREGLELTEVEQALTRGTMSEHAVSVAIATLSVIIAALDPANAGLVGMTYFLMPICQGLNGYRNGVKVDRLVKAAEQTPTAQEEVGTPAPGRAGSGDPS